MTRAQCAHGHMLFDLPRWQLRSIVNPLQRIAVMNTLKLRKFTQYLFTSCSCRIVSPPSIYILALSPFPFGSSVFYFLFSLFWLYLWMRQCSFNWTDAMRFINKKKRSWQKGHDCHCKHFKCANGNMYKWSRTLSFTVTIPFVATILAQTKLSHVKWLW